MSDEGMVKILQDAVKLLTSEFVEVEAPQVYIDEASGEPDGSCAFYTVGEVSIEAYAYEYYEELPIVDFYIY